MQVVKSGEPAGASRKCAETFMTSFDETVIINIPGGVKKVKCGDLVEGEGFVFRVGGNGITLRCVVCSKLMRNCKCGNLRDRQIKEYGPWGPCELCGEERIVESGLGVHRNPGCRGRCDSIEDLRGLRMNLVCIPTLDFSNRGPILPEACIVCFARDKKRDGKFPTCGSWSCDDEYSRRDPSLCFVCLTLRVMHGVYRRVANPAISEKTPHCDSHVCDYIFNCRPDEQRDISRDHFTDCLDNFGRQTVNPPPVRPTVLNFFDEEMKCSTAPMPERLRGE